MQGTISCIHNDRWTYKNSADITQHQMQGKYYLQKLLDRDGGRDAAMYTPDACPKAIETQGGTPKACLLWAP